MNQPVSDTAPTGHAVHGYAAATRTGTYGFLSALPLLLVYEVAILFVNQGRPVQVRVGADVWMKQLLASIGGTGVFAFGLVVIGIGALIVLRERNLHVPLRAGYMAGIVAESAVYAVLVAALVSIVVSSLVFVAPFPWPALQAAANPMDGTATALALSIGAGLYEEFVFRVLLVGGLFLALSRIVDRRIVAYVVAALAGAFLFSLVHYLGPFADEFAVGSFLFRFLFGLCLNGIFLLRGFGVAAWTHALYDVMVVTGFFG
jgi:membrane protease YdiL (CAAX protease family)